MKKQKQESEKIVVAVSGGFDPLHVGHVRYFEEAKKLGDELVVILNNDNWLRTKKGFVFMQEKERKELIESLRAVDRVVLTTHTDSTTDKSVCTELREFRPDIFANGGDRTALDIPEYALCDELGIKMIFNVGGRKVQSSSELVAKAKKHFR